MKKSSHSPSDNICFLSHLACLAKCYFLVELLYHFAVNSLNQKCVHAEPYIAVLDKKQLTNHLGFILETCLSSLFLFSLALTCNSNLLPQESIYSVPEVQCCQLGSKCKKSSSVITSAVRTLHQPQGRYLATQGLSTSKAAALAWEPLWASSGFAPGSVPELILWKGNKSCSSCLLLILNLKELSEAQRSPYGNLYIRSICCSPCLPCHIF